MRYKYVIKRHDGLTVSIHDSRHDAIAARQGYHDCNDYEIIPRLLMTTIQSPRYS